ncbi:MAG: hypothetical protein M3Y87_37080, partial [Myxococcota bacterium]|nr:hypothetical protein [Myxococcota bacterium]
MTERAFVRGRVAGPRGEAIAGWASLGPSGSPTWIGQEVRVATDEGTEVLVSIAQPDAYAPVVRRRAPWRELESDALARRFAHEAPA